MSLENTDYRFYARVSVSIMRLISFFSVTVCLMTEMSAMYISANHRHVQTLCRNFRHNNNVVNYHALAGGVPKSLKSSSGFMLANVGPQSRTAVTGLGAFLLATHPTPSHDTWEPTEPHSCSVSFEATAHGPREGGSVWFVNV